MRTHINTFAKGIFPMLGTCLVILTWLTTGYGGEWEPIISGVVKGTIEIKIKNLEFTNPGGGQINDHLLVIPEGVEVKWINTDPLITINGDNGLMPHGIQISNDTGEVLSASPILTKEHNTFSHIFSKSGTYNFGCFIHPSMKAKIVVIAPPRSG